MSDNLVDRAVAAQDWIGWAPMPTRDGNTEFASGTLNLARVVVELAREVASLKRNCDDGLDPDNLTGMDLGEG